MNLDRAPGLSFEPIQPVRPTGPLARADIALFLGYTTRGPAGVPVRIGSRGQFQTLFGPSPAGGHLATAVGGFFECGGDACYVLRVTDGTAAAATARDRADGWRITASFPWAAIDPEALVNGDLPPAQAWAQAHRAAGGDSLRLSDPGGWANGMEVRFRRAASVSTMTLPGVLDDGFASRVDNLAGIEAASVLELHQDGDGGHVEAVLVPTAMDPVRETLSWPRTPASLGFDPERPIRIVSVDFDVIVSQGGRELERFDYLSPNPDHRRALVRVIEREARNIRLAAPGGDPARPETWPVEGTVTLTGGTDGLTGVTAENYLAGVGASRAIEDIALIAAPDLMVAPQEAAPEPPAPPPARDCANLDPPPPGQIAGQVVSGATGRPLAGVLIDVAAAGQQVVTDALGRFAVSGLVSGLVTLRLSRAGFQPLNTLVQAAARPETARLEMSPSEVPRALGEDEKLIVSTAMTDPDVSGRYRVALLDPPAPDMTVRELRSWRARLGDRQRGGFYVPWLQTEAGPAPPSGHVAGIIAQAALNGGPGRAGANLGLRFATGVTTDIDEATHAVLNPAGINAIRVFPGRGLRIFGTRSLSSDAEWRFLTTRRLIDTLERTLERTLQWAVFEPNSPVTRQAIVFAIRALLTRVWQAGNLAGRSAEEAFRVRADTSTTTEADEAAGRLIAEIAVAPAIPLEFIRFRLGRTLDAIEVTE